MNQEAGSIVIFSRNEEGEKIFSEYQDEENLIKDLEKRFESYLEKLRTELQNQNNEWKRKYINDLINGLYAYINILLLIYI